MSALDTAKAVLAKASLFDQAFATPDMGIAVAWAEALGNVNPADCLAAVTWHYAQPGPRRIMPGDVLAYVRKLRAERLRVAGNSEPEYDGDDVHDGLRAIRDYRRAVADGRIQPMAEPRFPRRDVEGLMKDTIKQLPEVPDVSDEEKSA